MTELGGDLSHFEQLSAVTPKKIPLAIIIGTLIVPVVLWLINLIAPSEGVAELKEAEKQKAEEAPAAVSGPDIDDI
jgi:hypothetical protein